MEYKVYHDESQVKGYWHGLLFVPKEKEERVNELLKQIRSECKFEESSPLNFKGLKSGGRKFKALSSSLQLFILMSRKKIETGHRNMICRPDFYGEHTHYEDICELKEKLGVKFCLLKIEEGTHESMSHGVDYGSRIEKTFSFALLGGAHFMFNEEDPLELVSISFDGHKHYGRKINKEEILDRIPLRARSYFKISPNIKIDDRGIDKRIGDSSLFLMNLADNLVSSWRCLITNTASNEYQSRISNLLSPIWKRWKEGKIKMNKNSRWFQTLTLSRCFLNDWEKWEFKEIGVEIKEERTSKLAL